MPNQLQHITIEKMTVGTRMAKVNNPNQLLFQLSEVIKLKILPLLEEKLSKSIEGNHLLDVIDIDMNLSEHFFDKAYKISENTIENIVSECVKKISETIRGLKYQSQNQFSNQMLNIVTHYFEYGYFSSHTKVESLNKLLIHWENDVNLVQLNNKLITYLTGDSKKWELFYKRTTPEFFDMLAKSIVPKLIVDFLQDATKVTQLTHKDIYKQIFKSKQKDIASIFKDLIKNNKENNVVTFSNLYAIIAASYPGLLIKHDVLAEQWIAVSKTHSRVVFENNIKLKTDTELLTLINSLSSHKQLQPVLTSYFNQLKDLDTLDTWLVNFPKFIKSNEVFNVFLRELIKIEEYSKVAISKQSKIKIKKQLRAIKQNQKEQQLVTLQNVGIVLLHPFLPTLFQNLRLLNKENKWDSEEGQILAMYLLHYIAVGYSKTDTLITQEQLLLEKILVGYSLETPLLDINPHKEEFEYLRCRYQQEQKQLLQVIKDNWSVMKNCTWQGLQNDFFKRTGRLDIKEESMQYILMVNSHALDVLLPHKKWGVSTIKYSWMDYALCVDYLKN